MARGNVLSALAAARDLPQLSLVDALKLTVLVARKDRRRHQRVAARWLLRLLEEQPDVTIEEAALAAACLVAQHHYPQHPKLKLHPHAGSFDESGLSEGTSLLPAPDDQVDPCALRACRARLRLPDLPFGIRVQLE
jgi:hypothetical protein